MKSTITITIGILLFGLLSLNSIGQVLHCDSLTTPNSNIQLLPLQDSVLFSYSNIASDSIFFSQNYYVAQWVSINDHSIVDTIKGSIPGSSTEGFSTYLDPSQTYQLNIEYNVTSVPPDYSLQCFFNIYEPGYGNTCQIPFTLSFGTTTSVDYLNDENNILTVYPNPFTDYVTIKNIPKDCSITVYDITGKMILREQSMDKQHRLTLSELNKGFYILKFHSTDSFSDLKNIKIIKL